MFIKIKNWKVRKGEDGTIIYNDLLDESLHDVEKAVIAPLHEGLEDKDIVTHMNLETVSKGVTECITFPCEQDERVTEIFFMNDQGKTIDRYVY